jgi:hypothetical protein
MSKKPDASSGRVTYDVSTGVFSRDVDTKQMRQLQEDAAVKLAEEPAPVPPRVEGFDPYSSATAPVVSEKPRRTLDDMRKLSEEIKRNRQLK